MMRKLGYNVHAFVEPLVALEYFRQNFQDCPLVLFDVRMQQHMSGFEFVRKVKELKPDVKAILITTFEMRVSEFEKVHPSTKVDAIIQKPISIRNLEAILRG